MKNSRTLMKETLLDHLALCAALALLIVLCVVFSLLPAQLLRLLIDRCLIPQNRAQMGVLIGLYWFTLLFAQVLEVLKNALLTVLGQKMVHRLRAAMVLKMHRLNALYFTENTGGAISSRIITDVESVSQLFADGLISLVIDCFRIAGIFVSMWLFSPVLGVASLVLLPLITAISRFFQKRMLQAQTANLRELGKVNEHIQESVRNFSLIRAYHKEKMMETRYHERLRENQRTMEKVNFYDALFSPLIQMIRAALIAGIVLLAAKQGTHASLTVGMTAAAIELISDLFTPIEALGAEIQNIQKGLSGFVRIDEFLSEKEEAPKLAGQVEIIERQPHLEIVFDHVSFGYTKDQPVIRDFSAVFHDPDCVTFTGRTGAGKSTLFKLILGLITPDEGRITINGVDVAAIDHEEKRRLFGVVQQQFLFIEGTISEQIRVHDESITQEHIETAMKFVGLHETVMRLPDGYQTKVDPKRDFSQGQQQLLAIARAVAADPPILLLDEISASLDSMSEARILGVLRAASKDRILFSISHRLSAVFDKNQVISLDAPQSR